MPVSKQQLNILLAVAMSLILVAIMVLAIGFRMGGQTVIVDAEIEYQDFSGWSLNYPGLPNYTELGKGDYYGSTYDNASDTWYVVLSEADDGIWEPSEDVLVACPETEICLRAQTRYGRSLHYGFADQHILSNRVYEKNELNRRSEVQVELSIRRSGEAMVTGIYYEGEKIQ